MAETKANKATAGLRGASWNPADLPPDASFTPVNLSTHDGASCTGILARRGGEKVALLGMHPREFLATHYVVPEVLKIGAAVMMQAPRSSGNDLRLEHERAILDVAAGVKFLRDEGYEKVILMGNSGGASLFAFYIQQAGKAPEDRLTRSPAGRPVPLAEADMPPVDGLIMTAPHPGQGVLLMNCIDPSVTDEDDAMSRDPSLFPFAEDNGFKMPRDSSSYTPEFVERYRKAQKARVQRLDDWARGVIAGRMDARKAFKETSDMEQLIASGHTPIKTVWRTDADLRCYDLSLDPSPRKYGSLWGPNPLVSNFGSVGFGRLVTAESWLSTWSGLSSNASMAKTLPDVTVPTLMLTYDGDNSLFPADADEIFSQIGAADKQRASAPGNHHGIPNEKDAPNGREIMGRHMHAWLTERFI